jgi:phage regulator Rha-like protein
MSKLRLSHIRIENLVYVVRGQRVMLDSDLAGLYGVKTKRLNEQVRRNIDRFPEDFMFQVTNDESRFLRSQIATLDIGEGNLRSQNATLEKGRGKHRKYLPYVFTEHGAVMLASVLNSPRAIEASIRVVRVFVKLREILSTHKALARKLEELERKYDSQFAEVFTALKELMGSHIERQEKLILRRGVKE